jgi:hypothetical protein
MSASVDINDVRELLAEYEEVGRVLSRARADIRHSPITRLNEWKIAFDHLTKAEIHVEKRYAQEIDALYAGNPHEAVQCSECGKWTLDLYCDCVEQEKETLRQLSASLALVKGKENG